MVKTEMLPIQRKMTDDDLNRLIRSLERSTKVLKRLLFIRYRYDGDSVESAARRIGISKMMGYSWQKGLIPRYARKGPSKMSEEQKDVLREKLKNGKYTTAQVSSIIIEQFGIEYTMKQVWYILNRMGMRHAKPYPHDKRRSEDGENILKKT